MSKIVSTPLSTATQKGELAVGKDNAAAGGAGMFAGIFMLLNTQPNGEEVASELGLPELPLSAGEEASPESQERAPEETAALLSAMLLPTPEVAAGTAKITSQTSEGQKQE